MSTKSGRALVMRYGRQKKSGKTLKEAKSVTPSSLPYLYLFYVLTRDTATGSKLGLLARKDILAREAFFLMTPIKFHVRHKGSTSSLN